MKCAQALLLGKLGSSKESQPEGGDVPSRRDCHKMLWILKNEVCMHECMWLCMCDGDSKEGPHEWTRWHLSKKQMCETSGENIVWYMQTNKYLKLWTLKNVRIVGMDNFEVNAFLNKESWKKKDIY